MVLLGLSLSLLLCGVSAAHAALISADYSYADGLKIAVNGKTFSHTNETRVRAGGKSCSSVDGTLVPAPSSATSALNLRGSDELGSFTGTSLGWTCGGVVVHTSVRIYASAAIFAQTWPDGATGAAIGAPVIGKAGQPDVPQEQISSVFPAVAPSSTSKLNYMVYHNQMLGGMADGIKYGSWDGSLESMSGGTMGGPVVLWEDAAEGSTTTTAVVLSPITNAMAMNMVFDPASRTLGAGLLGSIDTIPANYTSETMLYVAGGDGAGPNAAMHGFGTSLRQLKGKDTGFPAGGMASDMTLSHLGYYTDNGAYYYYYTAPDADYGGAFRRVYDEEVVRRKIPFKYLQLDSFWYFKGGHGGVVNWTATPDAFLPAGGDGALSELSKDTGGWPFVAHNRYWGDENVYAKQNGGAYEFIVEPENHKAIPVEQRFWDDLMRNTSTGWNMRVYEQDWLHNEWEGLAATLSSATLGQQWLEQMGAGALKAGVKIQYCMSYARHAIASASIPAVNQVRASDDYATGVKLGDADPGNANLYLGASSMFAAALGLAPSKDIFWSNSSVRYPSSPPPSKYQGAHEPFPEVQAAVALLSCGPVGPGDRTGAANRTLLLRTCRESDGLLLKPGYPATTLDRVLSLRAASGAKKAKKATKAAKKAVGDRSDAGAGNDDGSGSSLWDAHTGEVNVAYSMVGGTRHAAIIGIDLPEGLSIAPQELGFKAGAKMLVWTARDGPGSAKVVDAVELTKCGKADFHLVYAQEAPSVLKEKEGVEAEDAVLLLGEPGKFCPHSPYRFKGFERLARSAVEVTEVALTGTAGERVEVAVFAGGRVLSTTCTVGAGGEARVVAQKRGQEDEEGGEYVLVCE